jgi:hypothetical protein
MMSWVFFGFLLGLQHALEADHIAAVMTLSVERRSARGILRHGVLWGLGHALTLGALGGALYGLKLSLDGRLAGGLEFVVGLMMVLLGARLLFVLLRDRIHFHAHRHSAGEVHFHAHSHAGDRTDHAASRHAHDHAARGWPRSVAVGMMHGLAGSAALVALAGSTASSLPLGLAFMALFGIGSMVGMAAFSAIIAVPLSVAAPTLTWMTRSVQAIAGTAAIAIGLRTLVTTGTMLLS